MGKELDGTTYENYIVCPELKRKLEELHEKKYELLELINKRKSKGEEIPTYIVELAGMPRTGKSVCTEKVKEFFRYARYDVLRTQEPAEILKNRYGSMDFTKLEFNDKTLEVSKEQLEELKKENPHIILQDRGVFDNYIWYQKMYENNDINFETYLSKTRNINSALLLDDQIFLMVADPEVIIQRDFDTEIFLEKRKNTTIDGVTQYRNSMDNLLTRVNNDNIKMIDTSFITPQETAIIIADNIINGMTKKLINKNM